MPKLESAADVLCLSEPDSLLDHIISVAMLSVPSQTSSSRPRRACEQSPSSRSPPSSSLSLHNEVRDRLQLKMNNELKQMSSCTGGVGVGQLIQSWLGRDNKLATRPKSVVSALLTAPAPRPASLTSLASVQQPSRGPAQSDDNSGAVSARVPVGKQASPVKSVKATRPDRLAAKDPARLASKTSPQPAASVSSSDGDADDDAPLTPQDRALARAVEAYSDGQSGSARQLARVLKQQVLAASKDSVGKSRALQDAGVVQDEIKKRYRIAASYIGQGLQAGMSSFGSQQIRTLADAVRAAA
ncbi:uncharacterized protein L969DRAFT_96845 [Mixia osmundae IAM 14324]|uniref:Uncharacterized protein n=1 Tax=Mixia osmundae (strain CBS 9802 / IAM 14324 / JCM 22182 / KY 12970) TaxID=764103 RepID=G7E294_MIXOS|nr:uncharacterized protein L969DRAFT_96845 [Mixia osmundae IAM 14324]KEI36827.1 hypothetical protein L969DRAFT_96845 [Mixia osmundae IAM 14324]GAA96954.1 hypothetical protein E5Q_03628 [Mixia osmundae IAM 14324]